MEPLIFGALIYFQLVLLWHPPALGQYSECTTNCICITPNQVLCNGVGFSEIPADIPPSVEHLSLMRNNISELKSDAFIRYRNVRKLYLDGNAISLIRPFAFRGLSRLNEISIQNTPLEKIPRFSFAGLHNLTNIYLSHNSIRRIESYAFAGTSAVRMLLLTNNPTLRLDSSAFSGLSDVEYIYLPMGLKTIEEDAFNGLVNVGHLKLMHLDLSGLEAHVFRGLRNVQLLSIQESDLGTIRKDSFSGLINVAEMTLKNNKIDSIEELTITPANRVKTFKFVGNHLLDVPLSQAFTLEGITNLVVSNNHFPCDCRLDWLLRSALATKVGVDHFMMNNFCISPYEVHGKALSSLDLASLGQCAEPVLMSEGGKSPDEDGANDSSSVVSSRSAPSSSPRLLSLGMGLLALLVGRCGCLWCN